MAEKLIVERVTRGRMGIDTYCVKGFTEEELKQIKQTIADEGVLKAENMILDWLDDRNNGVGSAWHNGFGIYGFTMGEVGCCFDVGNSCD